MVNRVVDGCLQIFCQVVIGIIKFEFVGYKPRLCRFKMSKFYLVFLTVISKTVI